MHIIAHFAICVNALWQVIPQTRASSSDSPEPLMPFSDHETMALLSGVDWDALWADGDGNILSPSCIVTSSDRIPGQSEEEDSAVPYTTPAVPASDDAEAGIGKKRRRHADDGHSRASVSNSHDDEEVDRSQLAEWDVAAVERGLSEQERALALEILKMDPDEDVLAYITESQRVAAETTAAPIIPRRVRRLSRADLRLTALQLLEADPRMPASEFVTAMRSHHPEMRVQNARRIRLNILARTHVPSWLYEGIIRNQALYPHHRAKLVKNLREVYRLIGLGGRGGVLALASTWIQYCIRPLQAGSFPVPCLPYEDESKRIAGMRLSVERMTQLFRDLIDSESSSHDGGQEEEEEEE